MVWTTCTAQATTSVRRAGMAGTGMPRILRCGTPATMRARSLAGPSLERAEESRWLGVAELGRDVGDALARFLELHERDLAAHGRLHRAKARAFLAQPSMQRARREAERARHGVERRRGGARAGEDLAHGARDLAIAPIEARDVAGRALEERLQVARFASRRRIEPSRVEYGHERLAPEARAL